VLDTAHPVLQSLLELTTEPVNTVAEVVR